MSLFVLSSDAALIIADSCEVGAPRGPQKGRPRSISVSVSVVFPPPVDSIETRRPCSSELENAPVFGVLHFGAGGRPREDSLRAQNRTYKDEVSPETLRAGDDILRTWLPQVLLEKFGVPETA